MGLSDDRIQNLYAKRRKKGLYLELLHKFLEMNEAGISVRETWPAEFPAVTEVKDENGNVVIDPKTGKPETQGKQVTSIKQGFDNAKDKKEAPEGAEDVDVIPDGDDVFLINKKLYAPEGVGEAEDTEPELVTAQ